MHTNKGFASAAALIATAASLLLIALVWAALHYGDHRLFLALGLLMAISPFVLVWRLVKSERKAKDDSVEP